MKFNLLIGNEVAQPLSRRVHCATLCVVFQLGMRTICTPLGLLQASMQPDLETILNLTWLAKLVHSLCRPDFLTFPELTTIPAPRASHTGNRVGVGLTRSTANVIPK